MFRRLWREYGVSVILACIALVILMIYALGVYCCTHIDDQPKREEFALEQVRDK